MLKLLKSRVVLMALFALVVWLGLVVLNVKLQRDRLQAALREVQAKIGSTERSNKFLAKFSGYLGSDVYLEKQARLKLNYKAPDEEVVFVYRDGASETPRPRNAQETSVETPFWLKWWRYIVDTVRD